MHQSRGQFSGSETSRHMRSSGDCITNMSEIFGTHRRQAPSDDANAARRRRRAADTARWRARAATSPFVTSAQHDQKVRRIGILTGLDEAENKIRIAPLLQEAVSSSHRS